MRLIEIERGDGKKKGLREVLGGGAWDAWALALLLGWALAVGLMFGGVLGSL